MIGRVAGRLLYRAGDHVLIDVRGVGYLVHVSERVLASLPRNGEAVALFTELQVREDGWTLFGFPTLVEKEWYRLLVTVQGVGAKVALGILSVLEPGELATAIATGDRAAVARGPGVGPKLAARIVAELKDKAPAFSPIDPALIRLTDAVEDQSAPQPVADAVSALVNLGYARPQASAAIAAALKGAGDGAEAKTLIRLGLRELAR